MLIKQMKGGAVPPAHREVMKMPTELKFDQVQQSADRGMLAEQAGMETKLPALTGASYVIGKTLGDVWDAMDMDLDEMLLASAMCFAALADGTFALSFDEVLHLSRRTSRNGRRALEKLVMAGFVKAVRVSQLDSDRGEPDVRYELQFPVGFTLS